MLRRLSTLGSLFLLAAPAFSQYQLVWADEFDGNAVDPTKWTHQIGNGCPGLCGWGNSELQWYQPDNTTVSGGFLTIEVRQEFQSGMNYTSSRLRTAGLHSWKYGRFEMRAKLPTDQGMWPAFWMLPEVNHYGVWAASGEMDIMEAVGHTPNRVFGTIHYGATSPGNQSAGHHYTLPGGQEFSDDFHVFAMEWDEFEIRWYMDGIHYHTTTSWWSTGGPYPAPFDQEFHLLMNVAVGGPWAGPPNGSTTFPEQMVVDYVRVYQEIDDPQDLCTKVFDDMDHADPNGHGYFTFSGPGASGSVQGNILNLPPQNGGGASLDASWSNGGTPGFLGGFGLTNPMDLQDITSFDFWINPDAGQEYTIEVNLQDDDNGDLIIPSVPDGADDEWQYNLVVGPPGSEVVAGGGWQHVSIPLSSFFDDNSFHFGGNSLFDPYSTAPLVNVVFALVDHTGADVSFTTDFWAFTERESSVSGIVWSDENGDGGSAGEPGLAGVTVELHDTLAQALVDTTVTDGAGQYSFDDLIGINFEVRVDTNTLPSGVTQTYDPDGTSTPDSFQGSLLCDTSLTNQDFGYEPPFTLGTKYCSPAVPNSTGSPAAISAGGTDIASFNAFTLTASDLPPNKFGYFVTSMTQGLISGPGGSQGDLCLGGQMGRFTAQVQNSGAGGEFTIGVDLNSLPAPLNHTVSAGETWNFIAWYRDNNPTSTSNFTDGVSVLFQ